MIDKTRKPRCPLCMSVCAMTSRFNFIPSNIVWNLQILQLSFGFCNHNSDRHVQGAVVPVNSRQTQTPFQEGVNRPYRFRHTHEVCEGFSSIQELDSVLF